MLEEIAFFLALVRNYIIIAMLVFMIILILIFFFKLRVKIDFGDLQLEVVHSCGVKGVLDDVFSEIYSVLILLVHLTMALITRLVRNNSLNLLFSVFLYNPIFVHF